MRILLLLVFLFMLSLTLFVWAKSPTESTSSAPPQPGQVTKSELIPTPLPAERFKGRAREAYQAAAELPEVFTGIACYCGCDKSRGHRNLLDCFADEHGAECNHCMSEALDTSALFKSGVPPEEIRQFIDKKYEEKHH
jgi:hypothetical protein